MMQLRLALVGQAGSGKSYIVDYLGSRGYRVHRAAYADELKLDIGYLLIGRMRHGQSPRVCRRDDVIRWVDKQKHLPEFRGLLQNYGETMIQLTGDEEYWAERCRATSYGRVLDSPDVDIIAITDCRKLPEAEHARRDGFVVVRILRTDGHQGAGITDETARHRSETELWQIEPDVEIHNDGTANFHQEIEALLAWLRRDEVPAVRRLS